jgi:outer membrane lipoprotein-sorting protein
VKALSVKPIELVVAKSLSVKSAKPLFKSLSLAIFIVMALSVAAEAAPAVLSSSDKDAVSRAEKYLNELSTLKSRFLQATSTGNYTEGTFYLSRPGKMRIEYDPPVQFLIVADGTWLIYNDLELDQITHLPLGATPANILLQENISLLDGDLEVSKVEHAPGIIGITLVLADEDSGHLTLIFADKPLELKKWIVVDPQGVTTSVSLLSTRRDISLDPKLFYIKLKQQVVPLGEH